MRANFNRLKIIFFSLLIICFKNSARSQCSYTTVSYESFEYTTIIPGLISGTTYQNTPQTFAGCIHAGNRGLYMNFVDGFSGLVYSQPYTNVCLGATYRFSFWVRDAWTGNGNMTFNVKNAANVILSTQTVAVAGVWQNVVMPSFVANTATVSFEIITNIPGGPGNDAGFDELTLSICSPPVTNYTLTQCSSSGATNLYSQITNGLSSSGIWTGPSSLTNGYLGTFTPGTNGNGTYTYTIDNSGACPDSVANVVVSAINTPNLTPLGPISSCGPYILPPITGSNLSGNQKYYSGPNGTGTVLPVGSSINTSQTIYMFDGASGCSDNETVVISISSPVTAGNDNAGSLCGEGPTILLNSFLSSNAALNGIWNETTLPISGMFNSATSSWNTSGLNSGNYTFSYTVPANGACPSDVANFTLNIGDVPDVNLGNDTTLCTGQNMTLNAGTYDTYQWNNGSTGPTKFVSNPGGTYWVKVGTLGVNQIVNGDFESGNSGFTTQYSPGSGGAWGALSNPGTYAITTSPNLVHTNFSSCSDHTPSSGTRMYVANGASTANTQVWCQTVPVQPNTTYQFGTWVASVVTDPNVAQLQFSINGSNLGSTFSPSGTLCNWSQFTQNWMSNMTTTAQICIVNQNTSGGGNDFAIDDITFRPVCYSIDTIVVNYSNNPTVNLGPDQSVCNTTTVTLDAGNSGLSYNWSTTEDTQIISPTTSGNYSVTVTNTFGCSGTDNVLVTFEDQQYAGNDSLAVICSTAATFELSNLLGSGASIGGIWSSFGANFSGTIEASTGSLGLNGNAGLFDFVYVVSGNLCPNDTANFSVIINQQPVAAPDQTLHFCNENGLIENFSNFLNHPYEPISGYWETSPNLPSGSFDVSSNSLVLTNLPHSVYQLDFILPAEQGCVQDTTTLSVKITAMPVVDFESDVTDGCQPLSLKFTNNSFFQGNTSFLWNLGDGTTSTNISEVDNIYEDATCYDVSLTAVSDGLCSTTVNFANMICVHPVPEASFYYGPQQLFSDGPEATFTNESVNNLFNYWNFGDGETSTVENPIHNFPIGEIGGYEVTLLVTTEYGCVDSTSKIIEVKDQLIYYVPNSFTPDGDEFNSVFKPVLTAGVDESMYHLEIFNRWGEILFESRDINVGWDGTYHGVMVENGTYIWKMQFGLIDNGGIEKAMGHINLLK